MPTFAFQSQQQALDTTKTLSQFTLERWSLEEGLPSNSVMAQLKAKSGYMWLATYDGLARFDGFRFKTYNQRTNPVFPTNSLFALKEDRKGNLWIATNGGGVLKMSGENFIQIEPNDFLLNQSITSLAEDGTGDIWVGTRGGMALIRDDVYVDFPEREQLKNLHIFTIYKDSKGSLWIGTVGEGLWELQGGVLRRYAAEQGLTNGSVRSIYEDNNGQLWIGTEEGIYQMKWGQIREVPVFEGSFTAFFNDIIQDAYGTMWFATNEGLLRYKQGVFDFMQPDQDGGANELQKLYSDGEGSLWIGTYYSGLLRLRDGKFNNYSRAEGLPHDVVNVVWPEQNGVWIGTNGGVAYIRQGVERVFLLDHNASANRVRDIFRDSKGKLWVGTNDGVFQLKDNKFERVLHKGSGLSSDKIRRIVEDKTGRIWIGTRNGLFVQNQHKPHEIAVVDELAGIFILSLFVDSNGILWVGTNGKGLYRFDGSRFRHISMQEGLSSDILFDVAEDQQGNIWVCSNDGLSVLKNNNWYSLNEKQGLMVNTIFQTIADADNNLWLTTNRGVYLIRQGELLEVIDGKKPQVTNYKHFTLSDGMRSSEITAVSLSRIGANGTLWFATLNGVSALHPEHLSINPRAPLVRIEKIIADKEDYELPGAAVMPAGTRQYEIQYTAFNYYAPRAVSFRYKLEGFDNEWQEAGGRRIAYYTNLPKGKYVFKVKAANEDGVWSEVAAEQVIIKKAYFWETLLFKLGVGLALLALLFLIYFWRTRQLYYKNLELERLVEERTNHISKQKKSLEHQTEELERLNHLKDKLLSVLSHDLRQPFSSVSGLLSLLRERQISQPEFQHFSNELNQQIKWQVHMLDNVLLWVRNQLQGLEVKPSELNLHDLVDEVLVLYRSQTQFKNLQLQNAVAPDLTISADADILHLVLRNLIGNAIKFTPENGNISLFAKTTRTSIKVEVCDDGIGIDKHKLECLFDAHHESAKGTQNEKGAGLGLALCKEFLAASGGKIWAESKLGFGSRFVFELPIQHDLQPEKAPLQQGVLS